MQRAALIAVVAATCCACGSSKKASIAELTKAAGPVERQEPEKPWQGAAIGAKFFLGDAARTADGGAQLSLTGTAQIAMQPFTVLRFGGGKDGAKISVELGAIDLSGTGSYGLDVGDVKLDNNGTIRITSKGKGESSIELTVGKAEYAGADGKAVILEIGKIFDVGIGKVEMQHPDAGVAVAVADAAPADAAPPPDAGAEDTSEAQLEIVGKHAERLAPGETKWSALPAGPTTIPKGTQLRLGAATTAKLVAKTTTLELAGGSRLTLKDDLLTSLDVGSAKASVAAAAQGKVAVPGGAVLLKGTPTSPAEAKIDVNARGETKVAPLRGSAELQGGGNNLLELNRGESATLGKTGTITTVATIPGYFDMTVPVGETPNFTIHDPKGATAVQFVWSGKCNQGGVIELDHDARFRAAKLSGGKDSANLLVPAGSWAYRLRCSIGGDEGPAVASGRIAVVRDDGRRPLPPKPGKNSIDADGRNYTISYQSLIPIVEVHYRGGGSSFTLHLATGGTDVTFDSTTPVIEVPGTKLKEAAYTFWVDHDGVKQDKVSTLKINFDQTAPQVYIEAPINGAPFGTDIEVRGAVLPGWTAKVDAVEIPIDGTRRFHATVQAPNSKALAIRLSHPQRGVHFYLRRGDK